MESRSKTDKLQVSPFPFDIGQREQSVHTKFSPSSAERISVTARDGQPLMNLHICHKSNSDSHADCTVLCLGIEFQCLWAFSDQ